MCVQFNNIHSATSGEDAKQAKVDDTGDNANQQAAHVETNENVIYTIKYARDNYTLQQQSSAHADQRAGVNPSLYTIPPGPGRPQVAQVSIEVGNTVQLMI